MTLALPPFEQANVLVLGDLMLDRYWHGPTGRISPEAPVPVVKVEQIEDRPGGAANVALNIAALGSQCTIIGITGDDEAGSILTEQMKALSVKPDFYQQSDIPTITKLRVISRNQQLIRLDFEEDAAQVQHAPLLDKLAAGLSNANVVILSDYAKGALHEVESMIALCKTQQTPVFIDPKGTDFSQYRGATLLTPNMSEFEAVVGQCHSEAEIVEKGQALMERLDLQALLVTRSEHGMTLLRKDQQELHFPAMAREVYDVTGAGDTVISVLASSVAAGADIETACALANIGAGVVVGKLGTSTVSTIELANELSKTHPEVGFGVISEQQLKIAVAAAQARGEKVVLTNGCFDILHAGHVSYLGHAGGLGDRLIVAVNDDASVKRLKGEGRPVNPTDRRMAVLAGLGAVDWVVPFSEDTPQRLISEILPNLLVKGGDYKVEEIAGGEEVLANGGEVKVLNFEDGCSTTKIIDAIRGH
ncbi:bifunctional D-glycero-beta-D-manno-heptose-7-phosphate kinase/D-glycero-beta-D-manno-heptose 1-phosphate adenylyltransferase HldE [Psychrobium sp. 1_MG-2023]|uniref:bifunctional D-glycero-beta-D-manno-heptose-7-phosphate kinase/D-glycero-beta-D-manno-heptose 1-phosphate adenylyltransferase HldE n=1 Tax=Psychrobium sp. 1_MG-2023 TaxID=3062624 RepID=UPI000C321908|nr:bifunctional D-glycero-beta-D-manno-heptose-7-phosphate kinase/D-glycero-beta-D-manno-heptose 1-phosphate adenylyltransferase HldE [Psychrobium sp. 1_MG-2023]MDP2561223.1 bifunctional D-glycero-beta-D-manno-heptose-7-phosphate kinase/D-glycero-beta-D-manno-heptose 1-phosphate adenylyltransferase HldE [Psychrobium sp. 1_MG-2023]PKF55273.1 bifunctional heptose 7-phosphate kinase/heptose 1-phosphate adenyltransferase [Alteromonadales bacterium alter-6D02]